MKKKNSHKEEHYKTLSLFLLGVVGLLLTVYIAFGLIVTTMKAYKLIQLQKNEKIISTKVGTIRPDIEALGTVALDDQREKVNVDVVVKEVFGKIVALNDDVITIETKVYGDELRSIRLKLDNEGNGKILKYETKEQNKHIEVKLSLTDLEEGMFIGVKLPVEVLLSEIEEDSIYINEIVVEAEYKEGLEE